MRVTPFRVLITLLITHLLSPLGLQVVRSMLDVMDSAKVLFTGLRCSAFWASGLRFCEPLGCGGPLPKA